MSSSSSSVHVPEVPLFVPLTSEQEAKVDELLRLARAKYNPVSPTLARFAMLCDEAAPTLRNNTRLWACSFLVARQWDVQRALAMLELVHTYRAQQKLDEFAVLPTAYTVRGYDEATMRAEMELPSRPRGRADRVCAAIDAHLTSSIHYWDKDGLPVQYLCVGTIDERGLLKTLKRLAEVGQSAADVLWEYVQHCISIAELIGVYQQLRIRRGDLASEGITDRNGLVRAMTIVVDARGLSYSMLWKPALDLFHETLGRVFTYYPDCVHRFVVVNCPRMVMFAYSIVKNAFTADMQRKVSFYKPDETAAVLERIIARAYVPAALGGDCHCDAGCFSGKNTHGRGGKAGERRSSAASASANHSRTSVHSANGGNHNNNNNNSDDDDDGDDSGDVYTEDVSLRPGKACVKAFLLTAGEKVVWEYATEHGKDVRFTVYFVPRERLPPGDGAGASSMTSSHSHNSSTNSSSSSHNNNSNKKSTNTKGSSGGDQHGALAGLTATALERAYKSCVVHNDAQTRHADTYVAHGDGALALVWDNKASWLRSRTVQLRVYKERHASADADDGDGNNVHAVVRTSSGARGGGADDAHSTASSTLASARSNASGHALPA